MDVLGRQREREVKTTGLDIYDCARIGYRTLTTPFCCGQLDIVRENLPPVLRNANVALMYIPLDMQDSDDWNFLPERIDNMDEKELLGLFSKLDRFLNPDRGDIRQYLSEQAEVRD